MHKYNARLYLLQVFRPDLSNRLGNFSLSSAVSLLTSNDALEFHRLGVPSFLQTVVHFNEENIDQGTKDAAKKTCKDWNPKPVIVCPVKLG